MNKKIFIAAVLATLLLPVAALAFNAGGLPNQVNTIDIPTLIDIFFSVLWPILVAMDVIIFIFIGVLFLSSQGDPSKVAQARLAIIGGVVVTVLLLLAFSIPLIVRQTVGHGI